MELGLVGVQRGGLQDGCDDVVGEPDGVDRPGPHPVGVSSPALLRSDPSIALKPQFWSSPRVDQSVAASIAGATVGETSGSLISSQVRVATSAAVTCVEPHHCGS